MKTSRFTETQIVAILKETEAGVPVKDVCRKHGISSACYYQWKLKYGGLSASELKRTKKRESENAKLKRLYAELALENHALKDVIEKSCNAGNQTGNRNLPCQKPPNVGTKSL